jgi:RNA polymerase sigma-70 factor (ECF subfamily)
MTQFSQQRQRMHKLLQRITQATPEWLRYSSTAPANDGRLAGPGLPHTYDPSVQSQSLLTQLQDGELLVLISKGEMQAHSVFYDRYASQIYDFALLITSAQVEAETVMYCVFRSVWTQAYTIPSGSDSVFGWLMGLTCDHAFEVVSRRTAMVTCPRNACPDSMHSGVRWRSTFEHAVDMALMALPTEQRQVLELACYGGLSTAELARVLNLSDSQIKAHVRLGLTALHHRLLPLPAIDSVTNTVA